MIEHTFWIHYINTNRSYVNEDTGSILIALRVKKRFLYFFWINVDVEICLLDPHWSPEERALIMYQRTKNDRYKLVFNYSEDFDDILDMFFTETNTD